MSKMFPPGRVVILLRGRFAGHKAVVVRPFQYGTKKRMYGAVVVAGIRKYPMKLFRGMTTKQIKKRSNIKPFLKTLNMNHVMPTRYTMKLNHKKVGARDVSHDPGQKEKVLRFIRKSFNRTYLAGEKKWFFAKLRF